MQSKGKIALITGANKGIGFEVARQLAQHGDTVLIGARNVARGREAEVKLKAGRRARRAVILMTKGSCLGNRNH